MTSKIFFLRITENDEVKNILKRFDQLMILIEEKQKILFQEWSKNVPDLINTGLNRSLLKRDQVSMLILNFDPELYAILKEVNYLKQMSYHEIHEEALKVKLLFYLLFDE